MSARIYYFPPSRRRRFFPPRPPATLPRTPCLRTGGSGFGLLLVVTLLMAFLYLSGAAGMARHDILYAALLAAVWGVYFFSGRLLRMRVLGPILMWTGQLLLIAAAAGFFAGIYWLILSAHS